MSATIEKRIFAIKENAEEVSPGLHVLCYVDDKNRPSLKAWKGKSQKSFAHYFFRSEEDRDLYMQELIHNNEKRLQAKEELKKDKQVTPEILSKVEVGTIFFSSWGYDQTNVNWYEVVSVKGKSVVVREIHSSVTEYGFMSGTAMPVKGSFLSDPRMKRIQAWNGQPYIAISSYEKAYLWDGRPKSVSWYA